MEGKQADGFGIEGSVVIVIGGSSGIGKACARLFASRGARVAIVGRRLQIAQSAASDLASVSRYPIHILSADISVPANCVSMVTRVRQDLGRLDVLVNCAAYFEAEQAISVTEQGWHQTLNTNAQGIFFCSQAFAQALINDKRTGSIINVSSTSSKLSSPARAPYAASKAAVDSLTRSLALELASFGIRVNSVAPGHTNTEGIQDSISQGYLDHDAITRVIPLGRLAEPEDIARTVLFLCSGEASFITGQTIFVDGGRTANGGYMALPAPIPEN